MVTVTFIEANGTEHQVEAEAALSLMRAAMDNLVPGIVADCGGNCSCATCHVHVAGEWQAKLPTRSQMEEEMLEEAFDPDETSRLACQITLDDNFDGLVVRMPERQI